MSDVWNGDILLPNNIVVKDVGLASPNSASSPIIPATLSYLSIVDTARIPLYLAAGPSFDVWTASEETEQWFQSILLSKTASLQDALETAPVQEWWTHARAQSPIGILVEADTGPAIDGRPRITEILFYGTIAAPKSTSFPTPPSSSPDLPDDLFEALPELRVHALPLSSDLLQHQSLHDGQLLSPHFDPDKQEHEAQFLPPFYSSEVKPATSPKRIRDIFDEATQLRKKARREGGEGVSAAAAKTNDPQAALGHRKSLSTDSKISPFPDFKSAPNSAITSRPPSRSPSISSDTRPHSRRGQPEQSKRSNLSHVATVPLHPLEPTIESRNKDALSKVIMAAMRMHGLQQRRKSTTTTNRSRRNSLAPGIAEPEPVDEDAEAEAVAKDEEYKLIYHQTFKGACLALRSHITSTPLHSQSTRIRDVVEKLLDIFCTDPLALTVPTDQRLLATPGQEINAWLPGSTHSQSNAFDLPSGKRVTLKMPMAATGSPVRRRKGKEKMGDEEAVER